MKKEEYIEEEKGMEERIFIRIRDSEEVKSENGTVFSLNFLLIFGLVLEILTFDTEINN